MSRRRSSNQRKSKNNVYDNNTQNQNNQINPPEKNNFSIFDLKRINPLTKNQKTLFEKYNECSDSSFFLHGSPGTGKSFMALYLSLCDILSEKTEFNKLIIIRSTVPSRDIGFLPGKQNDKISVYETPYYKLFDDMFKFNKSYENLKKREIVQFLPTSFLRGQTFDNSIILVDESQNFSFGELSTTISRCGNNSKMFICGDLFQNDLIRQRNENSGFSDIFNIVSMMNEFEIIRFTSDDIVRSGFVKSFIVAQEKYAKSLSDRTLEM